MRNSELELNILQSSNHSNYPENELHDASNTKQKKSMKQKEWKSGNFLNMMINHHNVSDLPITILPAAFQQPLVALQAVVDVVYLKKQPYYKISQCL